MLNIIFEDKHLIVCRKSAGIAVQSAALGQKDLESMLRTYLAEMAGRADPYLAVVHRLDQPVQGLVVFAKTPKAAASLSAQAQDGRMKKEYLAFAQPQEDMTCEKAATLTDFLLKDAKTNTSRIVPEGTKGAKKAVLRYEILEEKEGLATVRIALETGRHHQIRVQMAGAKMPLYGDVKYNPAAQRGQGLALCAAGLTFEHPANGKKMHFSCTPDFLTEDPVG